MYGSIRAATFSLTVVEGRAYTMGVEALDRAEIASGGYTMTFRQDSMGGMRVYVAGRDGTPVPIGGQRSVHTYQLRKDGSYEFLVVRGAPPDADYRVMVRRVVPLSAERDPIRISLRQHGVMPGKRMFVSVRNDEELPCQYSPTEAARSSVVGKAFAFVTDGEMVRTTQSIEDGPTFGKVVGGTFLIQYSTINKHGQRSRRWVDAIYMKAGADRSKIARLLEQVLTPGNNVPAIQPSEPEAPAASEAAATGSVSEEAVVSTEPVADTVADTELKDAAEVAEPVTENAELVTAAVDKPAGGVDLSNLSMSAFAPTE